MVQLSNHFLPHTLYQLLFSALIGWRATRWRALLWSGALKGTVGLKGKKKDRKQEREVRKMGQKALLLQLREEHKESKGLKDSHWGGRGKVWDVIVRLQLSFDWLVLSLPLSLSPAHSLSLCLASHWLTEGFLSSSGRVLALCSVLVQ